MDIRNLRSIYFVGIGGIGMSALVRYYIMRGVVVAGYDRTPTQLTEQLEKEGALIHYQEDLQAIPQACRKAENTLVVYTPAVPSTHKELQWFAKNGFTVMKRAELLGLLTRTHKGLCFAGTHGKTTTSAMCAHILHQSHVDCNAFLGGIAKNYGTNYILSASDYVVIEADEYDRSFHHLRPWATAITATDADHLDIYGTEEAYLDSFRHYTTLIKEGGMLLLNTRSKLKPAIGEGVKVYFYGLRDGDYHAENISAEDGELFFDYVSPTQRLKKVQMGQPILINVENAVAAMALAEYCGCNEEELRYGMKTFKGVDRRFDFRLQGTKHVLISDYAHHPKEIYESARSIRHLYPDRKITAIFQPHLYTRTRDFYMEFAHALSQIDEVVVTDIYPAREEPIEGVGPQLIIDNLSEGTERSMVHTDEVLKYIAGRDFDVLVVLGAGDLDNQMQQITQLIEQKEHEA